MIDNDNHEVSQDNDSERADEVENGDEIVLRVQRLSGALHKGLSADS
jgi:hypothetical protein